MANTKKPDDSQAYIEEPSRVFTVKKDDGINKDEAAIRKEVKDGEEKMADMKGFTPPVPDAINLKHAKPAFTEAIESMLHAVAKLIKQINPQNKDSSSDKNKPR